MTERFYRVEFIVAEEDVASYRAAFTRAVVALEKEVDMRRFSWKSASFSAEDRDLLENDYAIVRGHYRRMELIREEVYRQTREEKDA